MNTPQEVKAATAALPAEDRSELVAWLSESDDVWEIRREQLRAKIRIGLDEIARGETEPLDMDGIKREARAHWEARTVQ